MAADNKKAALEAAMKNIEKRFGAGAVMRLGQNSSLKVDAISTGSLTHLLMPNMHLTLNMRQISV